MINRNDFTFEKRSISAPLLSFGLHFSMAAATRTHGNRNSIARNQQLSYCPSYAGGVSPRTMAGDYSEQLISDKQAGRPADGVGVEALAGLGQVQVHGGGLQLGMSQGLLHVYDVCSIIQHHRGEGMPQVVHA